MMRFLIKKLLQNKKVYFKKNNWLGGEWASERLQRNNNNLPKKYNKNNNSNPSRALHIRRPCILVKIFNLPLLQNLSRQQHYPSNTDKIETTIPELCLSVSLSHFSPFPEKIFLHFPFHFPFR